MLAEGSAGPGEPVRTWYSIGWAIFLGLTIWSVWLISWVLDSRDQRKKRSRMGKKKGKKHIEEVAEGLAIFVKYDKGGWGIASEHDEIWVNLTDAPNDEDRGKLLALGWMNEASSEQEEPDPRVWRKFT